MTSKLGFLSFLTSKKFIAVAVVVLFFILSGIGIFVFSKNSDLNLNLVSSKDKTPTQEAEDILKKVGDKYLLPNEIPTLATVSDKEQLSDQQFFKNAENGDKVLIYTTSKFAILYRPSIDRIINVGPVTLDQGSIQSTVPQEEIPEAKVLILNGTTTVGLTAKAADLLSDLSFVEIKDRDDAKNKPYEESLVVYLNNEFKNQADLIAASLSAKVSSDLGSEDAAGSDIVVILGNDFTSK